MFVHDLYLIILFKKIIKEKEYDVADEMAQQEHSNIKCYVSAFRYIVGALGPGVHYLLVY